MRIKAVLKVLSFISFIVALAMMPPYFLALFDGTYDANAFAYSIIASVTMGAVLSFISRNNLFNLGIREGV